MRMMLNIYSIECCVCEGIFSTGEKVIEEDEKLYCESCYEEKLKLVMPSFGIIT